MLRPPLRHASQDAVVSTENSCSSASPTAPTTLIPFTELAHGVNVVGCSWRGLGVSISMLRPRRRHASREAVVGTEKGSWSDSPIAQNTLIPFPEIAHGVTLVGCRRSGWVLSIHIMTITSVTASRETRL